MASPQVAHEPVRAELRCDVERCSRGQQLPALVGLQPVTLEAFGVNLRQEVGADVPRDKSGVGDDFPQQGNVVGHAWKEDHQTSLQEEKIRQCPIKVSKLTIRRVPLMT